MALSHVGGSLMDVCKEKQALQSKCFYSSATVTLFYVLHMEKRRSQFKNLEELEISIQWYWKLMKKITNIHKYL